MEHQAGAGHRLRQLRRAEDVPLDEGKAGLPHGFRQKLGLSGREVIVAGHAQSRLQEAVDQIAADKTSRAGDKGGVMAQHCSHEQINRNVLLVITFARSSFDVGSLTTSSGVFLLMPFGTK